MPAAYQATVFRSSGDSDHRSEAARRGDARAAARRLDLLAKLNEMDSQKYPGSSELAARISSYELAYRMQGCAPEAVDVEPRIAKPRANSTDWTTASPSRSAGNA